MHLLADLIHHSRVFLGIGIVIERKSFGRGISAFKIKYRATGDQIHIGGATGEVEVLTAVHDRRTAKTDMDLLCTAIIEEVGRFTELSSADYGIVYKQKLLSVDKIVDRDKLHLCDQITLVLMGRHKRTRPGGSVLNEGTRVLNARLVCVSYCVSKSAVGNTCDYIRLDRSLISLSEVATAVVAHLLDAQTLVRGRGIAVIDPEEGADLHIRSGSEERLYSVVGRNNDYLTGAKLLVVLVAEVEVSEALKAYAVALGLLADDDRCSAELIACGIDALFGQYHDTERAVDYLLSIADTLNEVVLLVYDGGGKLGGVEITVLRFKEMHLVRDELGGYLLGVVYLTDRGYGISAVMGADKQRLGLVVGNSADTHSAVHRRSFACEFISEWCVFNVVDRLFKARFGIVYHKTRSACAEMGMVIRAVEKLKNAVCFGNSTEKTAHNICLSYVDAILKILLPLYYI